MKKYIPALLYPFIIVLTVIFLFTNTVLDELFDNNGFYLALTLLVIYFITFVSTVIAVIISVKGKAQAEQLLKINMIIKLIHIPAYIVIFIFGLICMLTIFTFAISILFVIIDLMSIFLTGLIGLGAVIKAVRQNKLTVKKGAIHAVLQFVFIADVISAVQVYRKVAKTGKDPMSET